MFHQGESNHKNLEGNDNYYEEFHKFYRRMNRDGITAKFYLSKTSYCDEGRGYGIDENLLNILKDLLALDRVNSLYESLPTSCLGTF